MKKDSTRTGATLCSSMRPRSATTSWLNKFKLLAFAFMALLSINQVWGAWTKVTSAPTDWSGEYLLVYESSTTAGVAWTGVDAGQCRVNATISSGSIEGVPSGAVTLTIAKMTGGYSIKVNGGTNNGKYIKGTSGNNALGFDNNAQLNTLSYDATNKGVLITSNTSVMRYNNTSGSTNERFRYFKSSTYTSQKIVQLYKAPSTYTVNYSGQKSGHFQPSFLAHSQIVIWGFFAFFCKKVFHIRCTKGAYRMHIGSRPSSQPLSSPFGTLFAQPPFLILIFRLLAAPEEVVTPMRHGVPA